MSQMDPIPSEIESKLMAWLPITLGGTTYSLIKTNKGFPRPECPAIVVFFSTVGPVIRNNYQILRTVRTSEGMDDYWGEFHLAILNVSLRAYDPDELSTMHQQFMRKIFSTRRDLDLRFDKIRFLELLRSEIIDMDLTPESATGEPMYMASLALKFEYELSEPLDVDRILTITNDIEINGYGNEKTSDMIVSWHLVDHDIQYGIMANIVNNQ